jgi:HlyD family secretion protein
VTKGRVVAGLSVAAIIGLIIWAGVRGRDEETGEQQNEAATKAPARISRTPEGDPLLKLDPAMQSRAALRTQALAAESLQPEIVAYGRLEDDPAYSFVLRAPIEGFLHAGKRRTWPAIGDRLSTGAIIGTIEPRFAPSERISLTSQLTTARSELNASTTAVATARAAYERVRILNADNKNVSDRVLQEAESRLKEQEERLRAARENVKLIEEFLRAAGPAGTRPLILERGGDVVEVSAQPGEAIQPGSTILRITRLDRLLARIDVPAGQRVPPDVSSARVVPTGLEDQPIRATRIALAPAADPQTQGRAFYFRLSETPFGLRPGQALTAYLNLPGALRRGVVIPRMALVRVRGKTYAYIQKSADQFVRKEVPLDDPVAGGYFTSVNFAPGDSVVVAGAQTLLSEEFKSQISAEETG